MTEQNITCFRKTDSGVCKVFFVINIALISTVVIESAAPRCSHDTFVALLNPQKVSEHCFSSWISEQQADRQPIAFYAYMRSDFNPSGKAKTLVFETVKTNVLKAYNQTTGIYTVPRSGIYVFNWVIREHKSEHSVELIVNSEVVGATFKRAAGSDDGSVSGTVVVEVNKGDKVFVRTHPAFDLGQRIHNNLHGRSSFSGWRL